MLRLLSLEIGLWESSHQSDKPKGWSSFIVFNDIGPSVDNMVGHLPIVDAEGANEVAAIYDRIADVLSLVFSRTWDYLPEFLDNCLAREAGEPLELDVRIDNVLAGLKLGSSNHDGYPIEKLLKPIAF